MPLMTSPRATETISAARAVRPLILAHHGHIHHAVNAGDQCAAKGSGQVFEIQRLNPAVEKIHTRSLSFSMNTQKSRTRTGISACALSGCRFSERLALRAIKRYGSTCFRKSQAPVCARSRRYRAAPCSGTPCAVRSLLFSHAFAVPAGPRQRFHLRQRQLLLHRDAAEILILILGAGHAIAV